jgi:hypothetical protein
MEFDKKLFEEVCRSYVLDTISRSKYLRSRLPLLEHAKIYEWTKNKASYNQVISLIISEGDNKPVAKEAIQEFENLVAYLVEDEKEGAGKKFLKFMTKERHPHLPKLGKGYRYPWQGPIKFLKKAAIVTAIILGSYYLYKKLKDPCIRQCKLNKECIKDCRVKAINKAISSLQSQLPNCQNTPDPAKCELRIKKEIAKWNDKLRDVQSK